MRSKVVFEEDHVEKTGLQIRAELYWYSKIRKHGVDRAPKFLALVHDEEGDTIGLERIYSEPLPSHSIEAIVYEIDSAVRAIGSIPLYIAPPDPYTLSQIVASNMRRYSYLFEEESSYRLMRHLEEPATLASLSSVASFSHGDLSVDNVLWDGGAIFVDPLYDLYFYSSWLDDVAAFMTSIEIGLMQRKWQEAEFYASLVIALEEKYADQSLLPLLRVCRMIRSIERIEDEEVRREVSVRIAEDIRRIA